MKVAKKAKVSEHEKEHAKVQTWNWKKNRIEKVSAYGLNPITS